VNATSALIRKPDTGASGSISANSAGVPARTKRADSRIFMPTPQQPYGRRTSNSRNPHKTGFKTRLETGRADRIVGPAHVLAIEIFGGRDWRPTVSSGGVPIEVSRLRQRTLMSPGQQRGRF